MSKGDGARDLEVAGRLEDPFVRRSLKTALHLRRYMPFYVFGLVWVVTLSLFPSIHHDSGDDGLFAGNLPSGGSTLDTGASAAGVDGSLATDAAGTVSPDATVGAASGGAVSGGTAGPGRAGTTKTGAGTTAASGATAAAGNGPAAPASVADSVALAHRPGKMRSGAECKDGVRQIPLARYAAPCNSVYEGENGGATYAGVSGDKIRIVRREFPDSANSQAVDAVGKQAGLADEETTNRVRDEFIKYFDTQYELYGRKIEWIDYESQNGDSTKEALGQGREGACADATYIKETLKAFAVYEASGVFGECAAQRGMFVFSTGAYYPESWYKKFHPYLWGGVMECERIAYQNAEYIGKRLLPYPVKWSGDTLMQGKRRKFGTYIPENDEYQLCASISKKTIETKYGGKPSDSDQYNYQLDISRFADQAAQAITRFKAAGVTTIVLACDPISPVFLMSSAEQQQYWPEWFVNGAAGNDTDTAVRLWAQGTPRSTEHVFGMSQLGATNKLMGPDSESGQVYKNATNKTIPEGTTGEYYGLLRVYNMLQGAGPIVHPQTLAEGVWRFPPAGEPDYPVGYVSWQDGPDGTAGARDHTGIDDTREIWWCASCTGPDGKGGTYIETYGGKRFRNGEWPAEEPKLFVK